MREEAEGEGGEFLFLTAIGYSQEGEGEGEGEGREFLFLTSIGSFLILDPLD